MFLHRHDIIKSFHSSKIKIFKARLLIDWTRTLELFYVELNLNVDFTNKIKL